MDFGPLDLGPSPGSARTICKSSGEFSALGSSSVKVLIRPPCKAVENSVRSCDEPFSPLFIEQSAGSVQDSKCLRPVVGSLMSPTNSVHAETQNAEKKGI